MQAWSARQATTHSPVIMQSVTSTQVKKPALQKATEPAVAASAAVVGQVQPQMALPLTLPPKADPAAAAATSGSKPPPSYEISMQQQATNPAQYCLQVKHLIFNTTYIESFWWRFNALFALPNVPPKGMPKGTFKHNLKRIPA